MTLDILMGLAAVGLWIFCAIRHPRVFGLKGKKREN